jgi:hypothetical protein
MTTSDDGGEEEEATAKKPRKPRRKEGPPVEDPHSGDGHTLPDYDKFKDREDLVIVGLDPIEPVLAGGPSNASKMRRALVDLLFAADATNKPLTYQWLSVCKYKKQLLAAATGSEAKRTIWSAAFAERNWNSSGRSLKAPCLIVFKIGKRRVLYVRKWKPLAAAKQTSR